MPLYASLYFAALLIAAAVCDARSFRIPNIIPAALALGALVLAPPDSGGEWISRLTAMGVVGSVALGLYVANGLGGGDVKLLAAAALWTPLSTLPAFVLSLGVAGGLQAAAVLGWSRWRATTAGLAGGPIEPAPTKLPYAVSIAAAGLFWLWWEAVGSAAVG